MTTPDKPHAFTPSLDAVDEYHAAYVNLGGTHDRDTFGRHLQVFFDLTFKAYILGMAGRYNAIRRWTKYMIDQSPTRRAAKFEARRESQLYFDAVDSVHPYT